MIEIPARIHILPARQAPVAVVVSRKPSKRFHVVRWNTATDQIETGSWFKGKLYPLRSDVSFDGTWMVYLAMSATGATWNGVCQVPWLKTIIDAPNTGTWYGGGYWASAQELRLNNWSPPNPTGSLPFKVSTYTPRAGEDEGVLYSRLERDGWQRSGPFGEMRQVPSKRFTMFECVGDAGWFNQFSKHGPILRAYYTGYFKYGRTFRFDLENYPDLLAR